MNLFLRPLTDINEPTWSVIITLAILLVGVLYYVAYILRMANDEMKDE
jgi:MFS superfamily sulfate permease-like transporter